MRGTFLGGPMIRIIVYWDPYWVPLFGVATIYALLHYSSFHLLSRYPYTTFVKSLYNPTYPNISLYNPHIISLYTHRKERAPAHRAFRGSRKPSACGEATAEAAAGRGSGVSPSLGRSEAKGLGLRV